jgi:uncharacterized protein (TIGR02996 family)
MDELLRAVIEAPDDDAPRLVYADALMRAGDPRGEFIALQLSSAPAAAERAAELLATHRATWIAAMPQVLDANFERGFAASASLVCRDPASPALACCDVEPIRSIMLVCDEDVGGADHLAVARRFAADARTARIRYLDLSRTDHDAWGEEPFAIMLAADLRALRELHVGDYDCNTPAVHAITRLSHLTSLGFHGDYHASLHEGIDILAESPSIASLETLILSDCGLPAYGGIAIAGSPYVTKLRHLSYGGGSYQQNILGDEGAIALAESRTLGALSQLSLVHNRVTAAFCEALADPAALPSLTDLAVNSCPIGSAGLTALATAPRFATMTKLWIGACGIDDAGLIALAQSSYAGALRTLNLYGNPITAAGARALADSPLAIQLAYLSVDPALHPILRPTFGARLNRVG